MKLSTKGRYGVVAMLDLAVNYSDGPVSIKSIAERQGISESYLEQLFAVLRKNGLVQSLRGAQGGYMLADNPDSITVGSILRALEGSMAPVDCVLEDDPVKCERSKECITRFVWERVRDSINKVVDSVTLEDLVKECTKHNRLNSYMYYI